jgi:hypothetical protein
MSRAAEFKAFAIHYARLASRISRTSGRYGLLYLMRLLFQDTRPAAPGEGLWEANPRKCM